MMKLELMGFSLMVDRYSEIGIPVFCPRSAESKEHRFEKSIPLIETFLFLG